MKETDRSVRSRNALIEAISRESKTLAARLMHELEVTRKRHEQEKEELQQRHLNEMLTVYSSYNKKIRPPHTGNVIARQDNNSLSEDNESITENKKKAKVSVADVNATFKKRKRDQILSLDFRDASISQAEIDDAIRQRNQFLERAGAGQKVPHYLYQYNVSAQRSSWGPLPSISSVFPDYFNSKD